MSPTDRAGRRFYFFEASLYVSMCLLCLSWRSVQMGLAFENNTEVKSSWKEVFKNVLNDGLAWRWTKAILCLFVFCCWSFWFPNLTFTLIPIKAPRERGAAGEVRHEVMGESCMHLYIMWANSQSLLCKEQEWLTEPLHCVLQVLLLVFSCLRKAAWDYGRLALIMDNDR